MCVAIFVSTRTVIPWDSTRLAITVPAGLGLQRTTRAVRAVLIELGVLQPPNSAICWCGEVLDIRQAIRLVPARTNEVSDIGA